MLPIVDCAAEKIGNWGAFDCEKKVPTVDDASEVETLEFRWPVCRDDGGLGL